MAKLKGGTRVYGDARIDGGIYDSSNQVGTASSILMSTGSGTKWTPSNLALTIPQNSQTSAYVLTAADNGKHISITTGGVTVPANIFQVGDNVVIVNNSGTNQTITQAANTTLRLSGTATTGNRTLAQYGVCTVLCITDVTNADVFIISGAGLS
jgi:hypothetical protein